jgi:hypothetical protein
MLKDKINIQDSLMTILLNKEYKNIQMNEILKKSKLKSKKSFLYYKNKEEILIDFFERIDLIMKKKLINIKMSKNVKDNLFEVFMIRIDILKPFKKSVNNVYLSVKHQPNLFLCLYQSFFKTIKLILDLCYIKTDPIKGHLKFMIFALIYFSTIQEWFNDFSEDSEKTMSILDKRLGMFEDFFIQVN